MLFPNQAPHSSQLNPPKSPTRCPAYLWPVMSPAALDIRSPTPTPPPQMQSKQQQSIPPQNPNPNPNPRFPFDFGAFSSVSSSGRSKPRLAKVRRPQGKSTSVPAQNESGLNPFQSFSKINLDSSSISEHKENVDNVGFVFVANTSSDKCGESSGNPGNGEVSNRSSTLVNSNLEKSGKSGEFESVQFGSNFATRGLGMNVGSFGDGVGEMKDKSKTEFGKLDGKCFVFGATNKYGDLMENLNLEKKESGENVGKADIVGGNWSEVRSNGKSVPIERQKMESDACLGKFDNMGFVSKACQKGSSSIPDFQKKESSGSVGKLESDEVGKTKVDIEVELPKAKADHVFVFGSSSMKDSSFSESTKLRDEMNKENREKSGNYTGFANTCFDKLGSVVNNGNNFVFRSVNTTSGSGTSTVCELSDEMRKLAVDGFENIGCFDKIKDPNINSYSSSIHTFVFGSNKKSSDSSTGKSGTTFCDEINKANLKGPGNGSAVEDTEGNKFRTIDENIFVFVSSNDASCSFGGGEQHVMPNDWNKSRSGKGVLDEQIKLGCPFGSYCEGKQPTNVNEKSSGGPSISISTPKPFTFQAGLGKNSDVPQGEVIDDSKMNKTSNHSSLSSELGFEAPSMDKFSFTSTPMGVRASSTDFRTPNGHDSFSFTAYPGLNKNLEFSEKSKSNRDKRWKRTRSKLRRVVPVQQQSRQNHVSKEASQQNLESPGCYSPMDFSPYSGNNCAPSTASAASSRHEIDKDLAATREEPNTSEGDKISRKPNDEVPKNYFESCVADSCLEEADAECSTSMSEKISINSGGGGVAGGVNSNTEKEESDCIKQFPFDSSAEEKERNFTFSATSAQDNFSVPKRRNRKKYRMKVTQGPKFTTPSKKIGAASSYAEFSPLDSSLHLIQEQYKEGDIFTTQIKEENKSKRDKEQDKLGSIATTEKICEKWRIRGNQAYEKRHMSEAEELYTKGINSVPHNETSGCCIEPLVLCYSNRAAARMSQGRIREALGDCMTAAALDSDFHKVQIRAANCHLMLGEVEDALQYFSKCLESGSGVCLDRRILIEAANGLQKAQKVAECMNKCAELLQQRTSNAAVNALEIISAVLSISSYSENLLEMKGEALLMLQRYEEVIQLCEQTLVVAEKNFAMVTGDNNFGTADVPKYKNSSIKLWRGHLMSKSYFHLGRLEVALDLLENQELLRFSEDRCGISAPEASIPFAVTVRELLHHKNAGNEAFQSGRHTEAVEHYTAAVSSSIESRPFAAICFYNRAAAQQALGQIADAIADCSLAIALDGSYSKAVSRRATLHEMIRDYEQAASDLHRLISLLEKQSQEQVRQSATPDVPTGSNIKELRQARRRLSSVEEKAKNGISMDHYLILGIKPSDAAPEIKKAYRKAALRHHPDKAGQFLARTESRDDGLLWKEIANEVHRDADRLFKMIGEAYGVLSDPTKRSDYDLEEELRNAQKERNGSSAYREPPEYYSSPFKSGGSRRYRPAESWKTYGYSRSQW